MDCAGTLRAVHAHLTCCVLTRRARAYWAAQRGCRWWRMPPTSKCHTDEGMVVSEGSFLHALTGTLNTVLRGLAPLVYVSAPGLQCKQRQISFGVAKRLQPRHSYMSIYLCVWPLAVAFAADKRIHARMVQPTYAMDTLTVLQPDQRWSITLLSIHISSVP